MKRIISLILAVLTVVSLVACAKLEVPVETEEKKTVTEEKTKAKTEEKTEPKTEPKTEAKTEEKPKFGPINPFPNIDCKIDEGITHLESSIVAFEKEKILKGGIVFYGSSGFTRWRKTFNHPCAEIDLKDAIRAKDGSEICVNHGFGSSTMHELCYYYERAIRPWEPKAIVVTSYINDYSYGYTNDEIMKFVDWLTVQATKDFPGIKLYFTDVRPRDKGNSQTQITKYKDLATKLLDYAKTHDNVTIIETSKWTFFYNKPESAGSYLDINSSMFLAADQTHYTVEGYKYFADEFRKALDAVL